LQLNYILLEQIFSELFWDSLKQIPYGKLTTYKEQAENINNPHAIRAVASANGFNRIAIIVPCHRVIGSNGELMGYGGGLERKRWLIEHEKNIQIKTKSILSTQIRLMQNKVFYYQKYD
jgi:AraC family transcriptional regulator, regulatory protein of adaptative response / methylated-DNA-[protein]-cysteine methyltransferase